MSSEKNRTRTISLIIIAVVSFYKIMTGFFGELDELWNYNMSRGIVSGHLPYRDFNLVQMPLFAFVNSVSLFFSKTLFSYRISCVVILLVLLYLVFQGVRNRTNEYYALPVALLSAVFMDFVSYNTLFCIFAFVTLLLFDRERGKGRNFALGIVAACAVMCRQTSGVLLMLCILVYLLSPLGDEGKFRSRIKDSFIYLSGFSIPCFILLIYLIATHSFFDFWDYCLFSMFSFGSDNSWFRINAVPMLIITVAGVLCDLKLMRSARNRNLMHLISGVSLISIAVPITDSSHLVYAAIWFMLPLAECIKIGAGKKLKSRVSVLLSAVVSLVVVAYGAMNLIGCVWVSDRPELKYVLVRQDLAEDFGCIADKNSEYEAAGYNVTSFSYSSVLISMFESDYDPPFDMFLNGNLGLHDPMEYVIEVCNDPNSVILIPNDYDTEGWQNPDGVYEYITSHCEPIDSYGRFVWYRPISSVTSQDA